ncbi:hypothetical protein SGGMMB4_01459 [Sodalis glossinidius str. 'morsitans']|uniref:Uncharacterized protein n=1 Tax=Sodalis glossinidius (strain morsitans) TaxID=343509 RepID=A0A193QGW1_SODGM|nr:hypothetical protein SGGMMB4_01459 [Sodalis glossinidius str. 'morsitans']
MPQTVAVLAVISRLAQRQRDYQCDNQQNRDELEGHHKSAKQRCNELADDAANTETQINNAVVFGQIIQPEEIAHQRRVYRDSAAEAEIHTGQ